MMMYRICCLVAIFAALLFVCSATQVSADIPQPPDDYPLQEVVPDPPADDDEEKGEEAKKNEKPAEDSRPAPAKKGCGTTAMVDLMILFAVVGACVQIKRSPRKSRKENELTKE